MHVATWNVNSIRAREARVLAWIEATKPDVLCLQELKVVDAKFPREAVEALGYHVETHGQPTYNGVAILSREPLVDVERGFGDDEPDEHARFIAASTFGTRVMCAYVPNGQSPDSPKFQYKLRWLERLDAYLDRRVEPSAPALLAGDFNVAPADLDVYDPAAWEGHVLCTPEERAALARVMQGRLIDVVRRVHPDERIFSWWDYRQLGFPKNRGLRIDHIVATPPLAERVGDAGVDREARKGKQPSDHAPVWARFD
jgi:exodeoxyribonuclease-3